MKTEARVQEAIEESFQSPNEMDQNYETPANVVDGLFAIARALDNVARAIRDTGGRD